MKITNALAILGSVGSAVGGVVPRQYEVTAEVNQTLTVQGTVTEMPSSLVATSVIYSTQVVTVISCASTVTNCPAHSTVLSTSLVPMNTSLVPITVSDASATQTPGPSTPVATTPESSTASSVAMPSYGSPAGTPGKASSSDVSGETAPIPSASTPTPSGSTSVGTPVPTPTTGFTMPDPSGSTFPNVSTPYYSPSSTDLSGETSTPAVSGESVPTPSVGLSMPGYGGSGAPFPTPSMPAGGIPTDAPSSSSEESGETRTPVFTPSGGYSLPSYGGSGAPFPTPSMPAGGNPVPTPSMPAGGNPVPTPSMPAGGDPVPTDAPVSSSEESGETRTPVFTPSVGASLPPYGGSDAPFPMSTPAVSDASITGITPMPSAGIPRPNSTPGAPYGSANVTDASAMTTGLTTEITSTIYGTQVITITPVGNASALSPTVVPLTTTVYTTVVPATTGVMTSTYYSTEVITITSCAASVTDCPARSTVLSSSRVPVSTQAITTLIPVSAQSAPAPSSSSDLSGETTPDPAADPTSTEFTTSTLYATNLVTVTDAGSTSIVTSVVPYTTTICPVSAASASSGSSLSGETSTPRANPPPYPTGQAANATRSVTYAPAPVVTGETVNTPDPTDASGASTPYASSISGETRAPGHGGSVVTVTVTITPTGPNGGLLPPTVVTTQASVKPTFIPGTNQTIMTTMTESLTPLASTSDVSGDTATSALPSYATVTITITPTGADGAPLAPTPMTITHGLTTPVATPVSAESTDADPSSTSDVSGETPAPSSDGSPNYGLPPMPGSNQTIYMTYTPTAPHGIPMPPATLTSAMQTPRIPASVLSSAMDSGETVTPAGVGPANMTVYFTFTAPGANGTPRPSIFSSVIATPTAPFSVASVPYGTPALNSSAVAGASTPLVTGYSTSTVYSTNLVTVTSTGAAGEESTVVVTSVVPAYTTICPVTATESGSGVQAQTTPGATVVMPSIATPAMVTPTTFMTATRSASGSTPSSTSTSSEPMAPRPGSPNYWARFRKWLKAVRAWLESHN